MDAAVMAQDRGVMTLAAKTGDRDGPVQVGWWGVSKDTAVIPLKQAPTGRLCLNKDTSMS